MNYKAIGTQTKTVYIIGSHADCSKFVNGLLQNDEPYAFRIEEYGRRTVTRHDEPIRILPEHVAIETEEEYLERMEKEMELSAIREKEREEEKAELYRQQRQAKAERLKQEQEAYRAERKAEAMRLKQEQKEQKARILAEQKAASKLEREARKREREAKAAAIKANKRPQQPKWTPEEEAYLRTNMYEDAETLIPAIWERFGRKLNYNSLNTKKSVLRRKYGMQTTHEHKWSQEDDAYIIANYSRMSGEQIGAHLGKKKQAVWLRARKLKDAGLMEDERYNKKEQAE